MEIFNFEKDMDGFLEDKIAVNCITEKDANCFLKILEDKYNLKWSDSQNLLSRNNWERNKNKTCYSSEKLGYADIEWHKDNSYTVLQYSNSSQNSTIEENVKQSKKRKIFIIEDF